MYVLRDYQTKAVNASLQTLRSYRYPFIVVLPTGSGKSLVIANIAKQLGNALILQPSKEILESNYAKMLSYGFTEDDVKIYSASMNSKEIGSFTYATIGSIYQRAELFKHFQYVIMDECHLFNPRREETRRKTAGMYNGFFKAMGNPKIMGLTATPYRLVQKFFREGEDVFYTTYLQMINRVYPFFFKKIVYEKSIKSLFDEGYLCPINYIEGDHDLDLSNIPLNSTGGDYDADSLEKYLTKNERIQRVVASIINVKDKVKHILLFASSIRQATMIKEILKSVCTVENVFGDTPKKQRESIISQFKDGTIKCVCVVGCLTTGFDFPELDCVILARPTMSLALYYQMIGRGIRIYPNKPYCNVIDCASNVSRFGKIDTIQIGVEDGYKNIITTEKGLVTGQPLFTWKCKKAKFQHLSPQQSEISIAT